MSFKNKHKLPAHVRPPAARPGLLPRAELTARLTDAALARRITLITAPSGFGKTTLLAEAFRQLEARGVAHIWLSVTDADRDPVWLGRMLLDQAAEYYGEAPLEGEDFAGIVNRLSQGALTVVMIDNWNFIESDATNHYFDRLVLETEGLANFVIASRTQPGFLYETYLMSGDYAGFGVRDLAFTNAEAHAFLSESAANQPAAALNGLIERTEGWAAGLQLLRLALAQVGEGGAARIKFSGSRADVANYLNKTWFSHLPPERRALLCTLAVLNQVNQELAAHVIGDPAAAADFAALERDNMFLTETSAGSQLFRFHSLFRDFLLSQHGGENALPRTEILRRAAAWHVAHGELEVAIPYAIRTGDHALAVELLEEYARHRLVADGKIFLFSEWVRDLLDGGGLLTPRLEHWYRWSLVFTGRWPMALAFQQAEQGAREPMIDAVIYAFSDDQPALRATVDRWIADGAGGDSFSVSVMRCAATVAEIARGNLNVAAQHIQRAKYFVERTDSGFGRAWVLVLSALVMLLKGRARDAEEEVREAIRTTDRTTGPQAPIARLTRLMAAIITYHRGEVETARTDLAFAQLCPDEHGLPYITVWANMVARVLHFPGEERRFEAALHSPTMLLLAEACRLDAMLRDGAEPDRVLHGIDNFEARLQAAREDDPALLSQGWTLREQHVLLQAHAAMLRGENETALHLLTPSLSACQRDGRGLMEQRLNLLKVALLLRQNKRPAALRTLIQAAEAAVRGGVFSILLVERRLLEPLLPALFEAGERAPLGNDAQGWRHLTALLGHRPAPMRGTSQASELDKDLQVTGRETEMLGFLDIGLSNREIGDRLGISVPTVKWHLHNLYAKIDVRNRNSAVRFARDNRLI